MIFVINKRAGLVYGPPSTGGFFVFKPGVNEVPKAYFDGLNEHGQNALEHLFADGVLDAELPDEVPEAAPSAPPAGAIGADHSALPEDEAAAVAAVKASKDRRELAGWLEQEKRESVFDALVEQLNTLDGGSSLKA